MQNHYKNEKFFEGLQLFENGGKNERKKQKKNAAVFAEILYDLGAQV